MLGVQHHALSPPASKLNGITVLSPSTAAAKLQSSPSLKNNSIKKTASPTTLDLETPSVSEIAPAWPDIQQEEVQASKENGEHVHGGEEAKVNVVEGVEGTEIGIGMAANGGNGDSAAVVAATDGDDGFADASRNLELDMAAIDAHLVQGFGSSVPDSGVGINLGDSLQTPASTIDGATESAPDQTGIIKDEEGQAVEAPETDATSPITPLEETPNKTRKSSSPLSDLSPVPTHDEDDVKDEVAENAEGLTANGAAGEIEVSSRNSVSNSLARSDGSSSLKPPENSHAHLSANPSSSSLPPSSPQPSSSSQPQALPDPSSAQSSSFNPSVDSSLLSTPTNALAGPSNSNHLNGVTPNNNTTTTSSARGEPSQKVVTILELNAELFKVCLAFQSNGVAIASTEVQPFSKKLSSNLTWLAAHVDNSNKALEIEIPLPEMDPPSLQSTNITIPNIERINEIYARLPKLFAKDIARRERKAALQRASATPSTSAGPLPQPHTSSTPLSRAPSVSSVSGPPSSSSIGVKRERDGTEHGSPNSQKRQNTGDGRVGTPGPARGSTPGAMLPPAVPEVTQANNASMQHPNAAQQHQHQQMRPGSAMGMNMGNMNMNANMTSPSAMMMSRSSSSNSSVQPGGMPGMPSMPSGSGSPVHMQNMSMSGMNAQSPDTQAMMRVRQAQMRQAQLQQQMHQMQQQQQQQQQHQSHMGMQGQQMPPQMQSQNPQQIQQHQQQQPHLSQSSRQMSPPHGAPGMVGGMGVNSIPQQVSLGMLNQSPGGMANPSQGAPGVSAANQVTPQMMQQIQAMGPGAVQSFQMLQNPANPFVKYLKESIPNFDTLPLPQQLARMHQVQIAMQRRNQANAANPMMANQMMANQMRNPNMMASGSGHQSMPQQLAQGGMSGMGMGNVGVAQNSQPSASEGSGGMFPNAAAGMANRGMGNNAMGVMNPGATGGGSNINHMSAQMQQMQAQLARMDPQQRQLYLMQMQQQNQMRAGGPGAGGMPGGGGMGMGTGGMNMGGMSNVNAGMMNPGMMNQQMLAQQQRMIAQRQNSQGSPLNLGAVAGPSSGVEMGHQQYPPGLRSNPSVGMPGIARSTSARSPSISDIGGGTPRLGGRMLPGQAQQNDEYHRALMQAQAQRSQMHQQQQQHQQGFMHGAGAQVQMPGQGQWGNQQGMPYGAGSNMSSPSPSGNWPQQGQQGYPMASSPAASVHQPEHPGTPRQSSSTPVPMIHHSPTSQPSEFDNMMNW